MLGIKQLVLLGAIGKLLLRPQQVVIGDPKDITGTKSPNTIVDQTLDDPQKALKNKGIVDSGCSRHMTGNKAYLVEYQDYNGGPVAFGGSKGQITGKGKIITGKLDFEDVYFVKELKQFNLFSVSQMCDKKNKVLFTDSECLVLSPDFKLPDENQVLLRVPRQNNMYSFNLENIIPTGGLACLIAKATVDKSNKWHRRLGHVNFKILNKLMKGNLVRGLPSKNFQNDHTCVACQKGKQHKASCKAKVVSSISQPLQLLHMDLFGPTSVRSINHKTYCLVITDDFSRFSWVFFLRTKDETSGILKDFIRQIENQLNQKVKTIRCDNGTEFKNRDIIEFCGSKGIKREYSNARTPQQNRVAERKNMTLIEPVRSENQANKTIGSEEANHSAVKSSEAKNEAEALRKEFAQDAEDLLLQAGAARATSTNTVNTVHTPISTTSPSNVFSVGGPALNNNYQDDSQIPALEDIYDSLSDGIFTNASNDDEGAVADFTNLESTVNVYINKKDERGVVVINKARIEAIRIFLAFASYMGFIVHQMDVKSTFLYGTINEEVYVSQPPSFVDPKFPKKVYKVVKALYGLHQAPRAWYATLSTFLLKSGYRRGTIDKTLFIKKDKNDIMLVQVYVDDIIFGSTKRSWCDEFEALMKSRFQMSSMGELTFFLGLQVKQKEDGIFISQDKYVAEILKKFDFMSVKTACTPIETHKPLVKDEEAADVDVHLYRSMIGSLMYLTASRPDIMFVVCACSRFQVTPKTLHLHVVKRIFRYLKAKPKLGLWYPRDSSFDLVAYSDSNYGGANLDRKSTTGGCQFLGHRLILMQCKKQTIVTTSTTEAEYVAAANCCGQNPVFHSKTKHIEIRHHFIRDAYEKKLIQVLKIHTDDNVADLLTKAFDVSRPDTTQDPRENLEGTSGSQRDHVQIPYDSPLSGGHTSDRAEGGLNLDELLVLCTNLSNRVLALETSKDAQAAEILKLKTRIKKLEKKCKPSISHHRAWLRSVSRLSRKKKLGKKESVSKQGRKNTKSGPKLDDSTFDDLDADLAHDKGSGEKGGSTVSTARPDIDTARPEVHTANAPVSTAGVTISTADPEVSVVEPRTPPTTTSIFDDEDITMAQTLIKMKEEKAKEKGVAFKDVEDSSRPVRSITTLKPLPSIDPKDKGKGILVEEEPVKIKRKDQGIDQIERDEELAHKLHEEELAKIARIQEEKAAQEEASRVAIMEMFDEVQAGIDVDALFAAKLQQEEREEYTIEERAKFLAETITTQRKFRAAQRAAEIRSGYKHSQLKAKTFKEIQAMYERQKKIIDDFKPMDSDDAVKDSKKAAGEDTLKEEEVLKEPDRTRVEVKLEAAEQGSKKTPGKTVKMKARKKGRKQTHVDTDVEHDSEEDERSTESMNKEDAVESTKKGIDASKKRKGGPRMKRQSKRKKTDSDLEEEEHLKTFLKIIPDEKGIIDFEIFRSDGSSRWIKTFSEMVTRFDRLDLVELYNLVMQRFKTTTPEGVYLVLWGDLRTMFEANAEDELWQNQEGWNLKSWDFYENYGVHILTLEDETEIHMLAERKYPLTKETLERMTSLKLLAESASDGAYNLLRFIQKHIDETGRYDESEKDL
ncbi:putative ribonuclease H-like domain-containing protein [Tanacetum coccineum]